MANGVESIRFSMAHGLMPLVCLIMRTILTYTGNRERLTTGGLYLPVDKHVAFTTTTSGLGTIGNLNSPTVEKRHAQKRQDS
jgi:hypothetical protein